MQSHDADGATRAIRKPLSTTIIAASAATLWSALTQCGPVLGSSASSTLISNGARWPFEASAWNCAGLASRTTPGTKRRVCWREVDDDGRIAYEGRFDEDDFEDAYRELDRRYYAGEGAAFAEAGAC